MNRNAAILALTGLTALTLAFGLAWAWRGTSEVEASEPAYEPLSDVSVDDVDRPAVLDRDPAEPESQRQTEKTAPPAEDQATENPAAESEPLLLAGRVVDQAKSPVFNAHVVVRDEGGPFGKFLAETVSDRHGRFEIRGTAESLHLQVAATKEGYFDAVWRPFTCGAANAQLELREGGVVAGRLLLDPWIPVEKIRVLLLPYRSSDGTSFRHFDSSTSRIDAEGRFSRHGITESEVAVVVRIESDPWDGCRIEHVPVRGELQEPRLDPIDLRGKFELLAVDVVDTAGKRLDGARVVLRGSEDPEVQCSRITSGGRAEFLTRSGPHDFEIDHEGFRRTRIAGVYGDQVVRLRGGIPVRIRLQGAGAEPAPPNRLAIALLAGPRESPILGGMATFEDPRQTTLLVSSPGRYEVTWYLETSGNCKYLSGGPGRTVEVRDVDESQELVLDFPSELLAAIR